MEEGSESGFHFKKILWVLPIAIIPFLFLMFARGENTSAKLYQQNCANCHMDDGKGLRGVIPPLAGADFLDSQEDNLPCIIKNGLEGKIIVNGISYQQAMPANPRMTDADIANLINYIRNEWGNQAKYMPESRVKELLKKCEE